MENKKLAKLALTGLLLASAAPALAVQELQNVDVSSILVASCGASSCNANRKVSYNDSSNANSYNARTNTYQADNTPNQYGSTTSSYDSGTNYNTNRGYNTSPTYTDSSRTYTTDEDANTNMNRNYNTASDYDYNRSGNGTAAMSSATISEGELMKQLNAQGKAIYNSLDTEGRALALQLASQDSYKDKNQAVKEAQRRINEQRGMGKFGSSTDRQSGSWSNPSRSSY